MNPLLKEDLTAVIATACNRVFTNRGTQAANFYKKYLKKFESDSAYLITLDMAYFGEVPIKKPGAPLEYDTIKFGNPRTTDALSFALGFKLTREALIAMQKKPYGEFSTAKMVNTTKIAAAMRDSVQHTIELGSASVVSLADQTTKTAKYNPVGRYGLSLCSVSNKMLKQPGTVWANLFTAQTFSQSSLGQMIQAAMTIPSDEGFIRSFGNGYKLLVGPKQLNRVYEILKTQNVPDSANNNENYLNQFKISPLVLPHLGASFTGYMLQTDDHEMGYFAPVDFMFEDEEDFETKGHRFSTYGQIGWDFLSSYGALYNPGL